jgi:hypothetical protein
MPSLNLWVKVEDGKVASQVGLLPENIASISEDTAVRISYGWYPVESVKPDTFSDFTEVWEDQQFDIQADKVIWTLTKRAKTEEELQKQTEDRTNLERNFRDRLLSMSDWVVIKSVEVEVPELDSWKIYRQALRDVPAQPGFPWTIDWPQSPQATPAPETPEVPQ